MGSTLNISRCRYGRPKSDVVTGARDTAMSSQHQPAGDARDRPTSFCILQMPRASGRLRTRPRLRRRDRHRAHDEPVTDSPLPVEVITCVSANHRSRDAQSCPESAGRCWSCVPAQTDVCLSKVKPLSSDRKPCLVKASFALNSSRSQCTPGSAAASSFRRLRSADDETRSKTPSGSRQ